MRFYKKLDENENYTLIMTTEELEDVNVVEISQEEYIELDSFIPGSESTTDEPTYDELLAENAELEAENAALLYQVLTGEELTDV